MTAESSWRASSKPRRSRGMTESSSSGHSMRGGGQSTGQARAGESDESSAKQSQVARRDKPKSGSTAASLELSQGL